jgi:hypothetical protein
MIFVTIMRDSAYVDACGLYGANEVDDGVLARWWTLRWTSKYFCYVAF